MCTSATVALYITTRTKAQSAHISKITQKSVAHLVMFAPGGEKKKLTLYEGTAVEALVEKLIIGWMNPDLDTLIFGS